MNEYEILSRSQGASNLLCGECFLPLKYLRPKEFIRSYIYFQHNRVLNFIHMLLFLIRAFGLAVGLWSSVDQGGSVTAESKSGRVQLQLCSNSFGEGFKAPKKLLCGSYASSCPCGAAFCQAKHFADVKTRGRSCCAGSSLDTGVWASQSYRIRTWKKLLQIKCLRFMFL